jgi:acyl carrier protein
MEIRNEVRSFLISDPIYRGLLPSEFADDFPLVESGALDSIGIINLVSFLEKKFGITIEPKDLDEANFGTILTIEAFVRLRKT